MKILLSFDSKYPLLYSPEIWRVCLPNQEILDASFGEETYCTQFLLSRRYSMVSPPILNFLSDRTYTTLLIQFMSKAGHCRKFLKAI